MTPLCELARKYATDKGGNHELAGDTCHTYTEVYWELFNGKERQISRMLEIGINYGASLRMWEEFFPEAVIYGIDSNYSTLINSGRITSKGCDQGNPDELRLRMKEWGNPQFDVIIDDGSHELGHQIVSANVLLPYLAPGGVYIIEDITLDCTPSSVTDHITAPEGYKLRVYTCRHGIGKAHCADDCPHCHGEKPEQLIAYHRPNV